MNINIKFPFEITRSRSLRRFLAVLTLPLLAVAVAPASSWANDDQNNNDTTDQVRLLWTNDTHGFFLPVYHAEPDNVDTYAGIAATEGKLGGYAQIATLVKKLKPRRVNSLFMDSGDTFDGSPVAQITRGEQVIPVLNAMGYDAMVPGNRDFAFGKADFLRVTKLIKFPIVGTTLRDATTGALVFPPYLVMKLPTKKVVVLGLVHPLVTDGFALGQQLAPNGSPDGFNVADEVSQLVAQVRAKEHPDLVVALSHYGKRQDEKFASLQSGIDVILGAHTHDVINTPIIVQGKDGRNVIVVQAGSHGVYLGKLDVTVTGKYHDVSVADYAVERIVSKDVKPDPKVLKLAQEAYEPFKEMLDRQIGYTTTTIWRRGEVQSNMANLLTDAYASIFGADLSHFRGIRYGATIIPGALTVGDVWNMVSPNWGNNQIYVGTEKGAVVRNTLNSLLNQEYGSDPYQWPGGDVMRFNGNVKYTYRVNAPADQHLVDLKIGNDYLVLNGVANSTNLNKLYTFAATTPPAPSVAATPVADTTAVDEIVKYIEARQTVSPVLDDRTQRLDP